MVGTLLLRNRDNALTLKYRNPKILFVWKCSNSLLDYLDTVKKLIEKKMQESIKTKSLMTAVKNFQTRQDVGQTKWRSNLPMFDVGQLTNGCQFWQKVEDRRKGFSIAWIRIILIESCTFEQFKDSQEVQSILHCKANHCDRRFHRIF